jgi:hypothetical protein
MTIDNAYEIGWLKFRSENRSQAVLILDLYRPHCTMCERYTLEKSDWILQWTSISIRDFARYGDMLFRLY